MITAMTENGKAGLFDVARVEPFAFFIGGFILVYGVAAIVFESVLGIVGFAKAPYLNATAYLYSLAFVVGAVVLNRVSIRLFAPHPLGLAILGSLGISAVIGLSNGNPYQYIVAWSFYIFVGILIFQCFRNPVNDAPLAERAIASIFSPWLIPVIMLFGFLSIFGKENDYQYVLFEVLALYAILIRRSWWEKALGVVLYGFIHLGSNDGFVQIEINRASILAVGTIGLVFMIYRRYFVILFFGIFVALAALGYALSLDRETVETLPRNIKEAIEIMQGDDISNHTSSYQRVYEGEKVVEDYRDAGDMEWLFGKGLGRTVDMTGAQDKTPGQHALLGATEVHNIHFLHFAVFHKFGLAGIAVLFSLIATVFGMLFIDMWRGSLDDSRLFFYFYAVYNIVFAFPASNFLIANPLWPAFFGYLCLLRVQSPAPTAAKTS